MRLGFIASSIFTTYIQRLCRDRGVSIHLYKFTSSSFPFDFFHLNILISCFWLLFFTHTHTHKHAHETHKTHTLNKIHSKSSDGKKTFVFLFFSSRNHLVVECILCVVRYILYTYWIDAADVITTACWVLIVCVPCHSQSPKLKCLYCIFAPIYSYIDIVFVPLSRFCKFIQLIYAKFVISYSTAFICIAQTSAKTKIKINNVHFLPSSLCYVSKIWVLLLVVLNKYLRLFFRFIFCLWLFSFGIRI